MASNWVQEVRKRGPASWVAGWVTVPLTKNRRGEEIADLGRKEKCFGYIRKPCFKYR